MSLLCSEVRHRRHPHHHSGHWSRSLFHKYAVHINILVIQRKAGTDLAVEFSYLCLCTGASSCFVIMVLLIGFTDM